MSDINIVQIGDDTALKGACVSVWEDSDGMINVFASEDWQAGAASITKEQALNIAGSIILHIKKKGEL